MGTKRPLALQEISSNARRRTHQCYKTSVDDATLIAKFLTIRSDFAYAAELMVKTQLLHGSPARQDFACADRDGLDWERLNLMSIFEVIPCSEREG